MQNQSIAIVEILEINPPTTDQNTEKPPQDRKPYLCRHIFVDGRQCGSRALRSENFCYYHYAHRTSQVMSQRRRRPHSGFDLTRMDGLDNATAIQLSLSEVLGRIANNAIDRKSAWLLLYGLQIASQNLRRSRPNPEAAVAETIIEDGTLGQLAEPEPGRIVPPTFRERAKAMLEQDPNADLSLLEV